MEWNLKCTWSLNAKWCKEAGFLLWACGQVRRKGIDEWRFSTGLAEDVFEHSHAHLSLSIRGTLQSLFLDGWQAYIAQKSRLGRGKFGPRSLMITIFSVVINPVLGESFKNGNFSYFWEAKKGKSWSEGKIDLLTDPYLIKQVKITKVILASAAMTWCGPAIYEKPFKVYEINYRLTQLQLQIFGIPNFKKAAIGIG